MDNRRKITTVGGLLLLACLVQVWMIERAVVPAQDAVRYLIVAQGIERDGLVATLRSQPEQPLFPALVWLVHRLAQGANWTGGDNWAVCLQLAAAIPLVLSVIPVYALFCRLHGERAAWIGGMLYCLLCGVVRLGADGLSDSTHLALFCTALWAAAHYFRPASGRREPPGESRSRAESMFGVIELLENTTGMLTPGTRLRVARHGSGSVAWLIAGGIAVGLALLARSEAIVVPLAVLMALALLQASRYRRPWMRLFAAGAGHLFGVALVIVPYLVLCDACQPSAAVARLSGRGGAAEAAPLNDLDSAIHPAAIEPRWDLPGIGRLVFGKKDTSTSTRFRGLLAATAKLFQELAETLHYWLGTIALLGLWTARKNLSSPLDRFMQCVCGLLVSVAVCVASQAGYLSTRHVLLLVVLALGWSGVGMLALGDWLSAMVARFSGQPAVRGVVNMAVVLLTIAACGAACLPPLHATRRAHREAAQWLAEHAEPNEAVLDSRGFTALYTGCKTYRYEAAQAAFADPKLTYVVVERQELESKSRRSETMRLLLSHAGEVVARFAAADSQKHGVIVHRWRPERFQQLGVQSYAR